MGGTGADTSAEHSDDGGAVFATLFATEAAAEGETEETVACAGDAIAAVCFVSDSVGGGTACVSEDAGVAAAAAGEAVGAADAVAGGAVDVLVGTGTSPSLRTLTLPSILPPFSTMIEPKHRSPFSLPVEQI